MFSKIPMPRVEWKKENMRFALCALPLVGVVTGAALWIWTALCAGAGFGKPLFAAGVLLLPLLISGGIHLDGFADTVDALSSHAAPERKREILKDPHAGAFAVIWVCAYLLAGFALATELTLRPGLGVLLALIPVISRILGGLCSLLLPTAGKEGLLTTFRTGADERVAPVVLLSELAACLVALFCVNAPAVIGMLIAALAVVLVVYRMATKQFGGMSGDLAGFAISVAELMLLGMLVLLQKVVLV